MKDKKSPFFAFRYMVTPISFQTSIYNEISKSKEELMRDVVCLLNKNTKTDWLRGNKRYLIYGFQKKNNFFILKYARESKENIYVEEDSDIEIKGIKQTKFVYLIIDIEHQIILIERNTSVFSSVRSAINVLSEYFREKMRKFDYAVNIYPLVSKKGFWNYIDEADEIFELSLLLNAPNMPFLGDPNTKSVLQDIKDLTNNEEFEVSLRNKDGSLKVVKESIGSWINYIREVGGRYMVKYKKNGVEQRKTSYDDTAKTYIHRKKINNYSDDELKDIEDKLKLMNNIENRGDSEDEEK